MRIVLDTNVLASALGWAGNERKVLLSTFSEDIDLLLSEDIISEFIHVISSDKFSYVPVEKISHFLEIIMETSIIIKTNIKITAIKDDPEDNRILACAIEGKADYIVSGDRHLLALGKHEGTRILSARDFLTQRKRKDK
jgi:putative PIN family toxin of toxin-antitoxin system